MQGPGLRMMFPGHAAGGNLSDLAHNSVSLQGCSNLVCVVDHDGLRDASVFLDSEHELLRYCKMSREAPRTLE